MTTQTNAWNLTSDEAVWIERVASEKPFFERIIFRVEPLIGMVAVAAMTRDGGLMVPGQDGKWTTPELPEPPAEFSAALRDGRIPSVSQPR